MINAEGLYSIFESLGVAACLFRTDFYANAQIAIPVSEKPDLSLADIFTLCDRIGEAIGKPVKWNRADDDFVYFFIGEETPEEHAEPRETQREEPKEAEISLKSKLKKLEKEAERVLEKKSGFKIIMGLDELRERALEREREEEEYAKRALEEEIKKFKVAAFPFHFGQWRSAPKYGLETGDYYVDIHENAGSGLSESEKVAILEKATFAKLEQVHETKFGRISYKMKNPSEYHRYLAHAVHSRNLGVTGKLQWRLNSRLCYEDLHYALPFIKNWSTSIRASFEDGKFVVDLDE